MPKGTSILNDQFVAIYLLSMASSDFISRNTHCEKKPEGSASPPGTICTRAGNDRGYAIASCMAANDSA